MSRELLLRIANALSNGSTRCAKNHMLKLIADIEDELRKPERTPVAWLAEDGRLFGEKVHHSWLKLTPLYKD